MTKGLDVPFHAPISKGFTGNIVIDFTISIEPIQWNVAASMPRPLHLISNRALLIAIRILSSENTASETHHR